MSDSSGRFRISPSVHPPHTLFICQLIDCKYVFLRARKPEEARRLLALLDLRRAALRAFFPARCLVLRDCLQREHGAFLPFLQRLFIIPLFFFFSKRFENIIHLLRLSFIFYRLLFKALSDQSSFYSSGNFHHL